MRTEGEEAERRPELSVIIPAYNEEDRLGPTLDSVAGFLEASGTDYEILVVDDGSTDGTADLVRRRATQSPRLRLVRNPRNRGKGYSVRRGVEEARGRLVLFSDADNSTPPEEMAKLLPKLQAEGYDIAIGSRALKESVLEVRQPFYREYMGRAFNLIRSAASRRSRPTWREPSSPTRPSSGSASMSRCFTSHSTSTGSGASRYPCAGSTPPGVAFTR
jgi:glycosyltransferase involved in cell wall biosynthesis